MTTKNERQADIRQNVYNMHEETAEFIKNVDVRIVQGGRIVANRPADYGKEYTLTPIEADKLAEWVRKNSKCIPQSPTVDKGFSECYDSTYTDNAEHR